MPENDRTERPGRPGKPGNTRKPPADQILERYLLDELPARERRRVEKILGHDAGAAARLEALKASNAEILAAYPPAEMAARIRARAWGERAATAATEQKARRARPFRLPSFAMPVAAAALILMVILPFRTALTSREETRVKGLEARLEIFRRRGAGSEPLAAGTRVAEGDLLQIAYVAGEAGYGVIFSIDGRGTVTFHYPRLPGTSTSAPAAEAVEAPPLEPGGKTALPTSYQLDDAPGFERFFFVTSAEPFELASIWQAASRLAADTEAARREPLELARGLEQDFLLLSKNEAP
jgi:hypothetical protein